LATILRGSSAFPHVDRAVDRFKCPLKYPLKSTSFGGHRLRQPVLGL